MDYSLSSAGETYLPFNIETLKTELAKSLLYQKKFQSTSRQARCGLKVQNILAIKPNENEKFKNIPSEKLRHYLSILRALIPNLSRLFYPLRSD